MGLSFAQTLGNAAQSYEEARKSNIAEQQTAQELKLRQDQLAKTLNMEMLRIQIEKARAASEEGRFAAEQERLKNSGWSKVGVETQNPDGTWTSHWYNPATGESREFKQGTPKAIVQQGMKGDQAEDLEKLRAKDKLDQIAASGRWHTKWAEIAAQGKLKKEDWNALRTDPGYIKAVGEMKANLGARNNILSRMYSTLQPPTPQQMAELNQQLQQVDQQLEQSSKAAEQVRNKVRFGPVPDLGQLKGMLPGGGDNKVKTLTRAKRDQYLRDAGGDPVKARALAIKDGYDISKTID